MQFLDAFEDDQRSLFESAASRLELVRGELLLKKGDPGGDVFVLMDGVLEVLDRNNPELIVARLHPGEVVGEMAFIDDSPRSVDVRAEEGATVLRWARDDLRALLLRREDIAARFYRVVCHITSNRTRQVTEGVTSRAYNRGQSVSQEGLQRVREESRDLSERAKSRFLEVDTALRRNPNDDEAVAQVLESLDALQKRVHKLFSEHPEPEACEAAAEISRTS